MRWRLMLAIVYLSLRSGTAMSDATFSMPYVDLVPNDVSSPVMLAVWSSTNEYVTKSTAAYVIFPPDMSIPAGLNPGACQCIFLKHTSTTAGTWAASEVTITAGIYPGSGQMVGVSLPADLHPGKFYIRFDTTAGIESGPYDGVATVALVDPSSNTTVSQGFYIKPSYTASAALGVLSGTVKTTTGKAVPGALVMVSNTGTFLPTSLGPRKNFVSPTGVSSNVHVVAASSDGSYSVSIPPGTYTAVAEASNHKGNIANTVTSIGATVTIVSNSTTPQDFSLAPLP